MVTVTALPFDPTGTMPTNKIVGEQQVITSVNFRDYHYIIPNQAPFFAESLVIGFKNPDGSARSLVEGVDYYLSHEFISASRACAKPVFGSIEFLFTDLAGVVTLNYQSIGGDWTLDQATIATIIANSLNNPRTTSWEEVANPPYAFPVINHEWDLVDMVGASDIVNSLEDIREVISEGGATGLAAHEADKNNPHDVTAAQVGLGNVQNFPLASVSQAQSGTNATTYMTPYLTAQAITALGQGGLQSHLTDYGNPHQTTKAQVGLGNVQNYPLATPAQATAGTDNATYMTPALTAAVVSIVNAALTNHVNNQQNPHNTTKDQILLFNVANYAPATAQQAEAGTDNATYMTPLRTAQAIALQSNTNLQAHLSDYTNPHQTTKVQVGLGSVDNFATASGSEAIDQSNSSRFMTPQRTYASVMNFVGNDFLTHVNAANPHNVTAAQVGLGNVQNYAIATQADAQAGTSNTLYMTPLMVAKAISVMSTNGLAAHVSNYSNPHQVTKAQVGLANVDNFGTATQTDVQTGTSDTLFVTPHGVSQAITFQVGTAFATHIAASNPHGTTANDVGLGNVQNFGIATDAQATAASVNTAYLTPHSGAILSSAVSTPLITAHTTRTDNPHSVTAAQVGLGNVQNFGVASVSQAQSGTDTQTYMTPALTAQAIAAIATSGLNAHLADYSNPHQTTAAQVGAYSVAQTNQLLLQKLNTGDTAANSSQLGGYTYATVLSNVAAQTTSQINTFSASTVLRGQVAQNAADTNNSTGYSWAVLGTLTALAGNTAFTPDLYWQITGGENPSAINGVITLLRFSIRDTNDVNNPINYFLQDQTPSLATGGVDFGYAWNASTKTATIYARMPVTNNPLTVNELGRGGASIAVNYLGYQSVPTVTMMTRTPSLPAMQAQLTQLQSDVVSGLAALTTALNNM